uniref:Uncharacterized protein n=1 Tax=Ciona intestinalis TaxID=7719 RepID=H2XW77_CIOIN
NKKKTWTILLQPIYTDLPSLVDLSEDLQFVLLVNSSLSGRLGLSICLLLVRSMMHYM